MVIFFRCPAFYVESAGVWERPHVPGGDTNAVMSGVG